MMAAIFIQAGYGKAMAPSATIAMFTHLGLPLPGAGYALALAIELGVATAFLLGYRARPASIVLAAWCLATAMIAHYHPANPAQMINFMKNLCMAGGFLQIAAFGPGRFSLDRG